MIQSKKTRLFIYGAALSLLFFSSAAVASAAAPGLTSAILQNTSSTTVDMYVLGTNFSKFVNSNSATANDVDLAGLSYGNRHPTSAVILKMEA